MGHALILTGTGGSARSPGLHAAASWLRVLSAVAILGAGSRAASAEGPVPPHQTLAIESKVLEETRRINVYVPPGYERAPRIRYPVLYMPDGGLEEDFPHVARDVDTAIRAGEMRPVIVVGIENTERRRDMTGPTEVASDRKIAPRVGGSARFRGFIRDELMPVVRQRFRGNGETAIVGESLAGLFVLETFLQEPALFQTYIALSPSLWWNAGALVRAAAGRLRAPARPGSAVTLYFATAGDDELEASAGDLSAALRAAPQKGLTWYFEAWPHEKHSTIYSAISPAVFRKLFSPARRRSRAMERGGEVHEIQGSKVSRHHENGRERAQVSRVGDEPSGAESCAAGPFFFFGARARREALC